MKNLRKGLILYPTLVALVLVAGCAPKISSSSSRVELFSSVQDLAKASDDIVVGKVLSQETRQDINQGIDFTISTIQISKPLKTDLAHKGVTTFHVRQVGKSDTLGIAPILKTDSTYLLYLTKSGLTGELSSQFYITGDNAGIYVASTSDSQIQEYRQIQRTPGESLPSLLTEATATY